MRWKSWGRDKIFRVVIVQGQLQERVEYWKQEGMKKAYFKRG